MKALRRARRAIGLFVALLLAAPGTATADEALETQIRALRAQRKRIRLAAPIAGVVIGGLLVENGFQNLVEVQFHCPGLLAWDWNCSHETRRAITIGSGSALAVGAVVMAISVPILSRRLRARRALAEEVNRLRSGGSEEATAHHPGRPRWQFGLDVLGERKAVLAVVRF